MVGLKSVISGTDPDVNVPVVTGDYGAAWADLVLPTITAAVPCFLIAHNTNGSDSWRLYVHDGSTWNLCPLPNADLADVPIPVDSADYGAAWGSYTPPAITAVSPHIRVVHNTNGGDSWRLYVHDGTAWKFVSVAAADPIDIPVAVDIGDYGAAWGDYAPPAITASIGHIRIAKNSNGDGSWRIYAHDGTAWKSAALT